MAPIRLRHPKGVSTLDIDLNSSSTTIEELQSMIFSITEIEPSRQDLKCGYPPRGLEIIESQLPVSSLGIERGDQIVVSEMKVGRTMAASVVAPPPAPSVSRSGPTSRNTANVSSAPRVATNTVQPQSQTLSTPASSSKVESVRVPGGFLVHRVVPDDNSCLFSSIGLIFEQDMGAASKLRQVVADAIRNDWDTWNEAVLGRPREEYIQTILKPTAWGGAIELSIFSKHYSTEICSIDIETLRVDRFNDVNNPYTSRCIVLYSGIHYDAVSLAPAPDVPLDFHETVFSIGGDGVGEGENVEGAKKLAERLRKKGMYTNTATFDLRCQICKKGLKGETEARKHASETGHVDFGEYRD